MHWIRSPNDAPIDSPEAARAAHHGDFDSPRYRVVASTLARICRDRKVSVTPTRFARTAPSRRELRQRLDALTGPRPR